MTDLLPLKFGLSPAVSRYAALSNGDLVDASVSGPMRAHVLDRDQWTCRYCGFASAKYQEVVSVDGTFHDADRLHTACPFCRSVLELDRADEKASGVLIWAPEISQVDLCASMRAVYVWRLRHGEQGERARAVLQILEARREFLLERAGVADLAALVARLKDGGRLTEPMQTGMRLLPQARMTVNEGDLRFNKFPQILAFWRSSQGPLREVDPLVGVPLLEAALKAPPVEAVVEEAPRVHVLASRLLRDAGVFFRTIAGQNPPISEKMIENAKVFEHMAELLTDEPMGFLGGDASDAASGAEDGRTYKVGAKLLIDAADFFEVLGTQNPPLAEQMRSNAETFREIAAILSNDPMMIMGR